MKMKFKKIFNRKVNELECIKYFKKNISKDKKDVQLFKQDIRFFAGEDLYLVLKANSIQKLELLINAKIDLDSIELGCSKMTYKLGNAYESFVNIIFTESFNDVELDKHQNFQTKQPVYLSKWYTPKGMFQRLRGLFYTAKKILSRKRNKKRS